MPEEWYKGWKRIWGGEAEVEDVDIDFIEPEPLEKEDLAEEGD